MTPSYSLRRSLLALTALAGLSQGALADPDPDYVLRAGYVVGDAGDVVTLPITLDNTGLDLQGWSFGVSIPPALTIVDARDGATTAAFGGGAGPWFNAVSIYPGEGVTVGVVTDFMGVELLPPGLGHELLEIDVAIPPNAPPGTSYPVSFVETIGDPPVATIVVVVGGISVDPTLEGGGVVVPQGNYCASVPNSTGAPAVMSATGTLSIAANGLVLNANPVPTQPGIFYFGPNQIQIPFGNGFRCVGGTVHRLPVEFGQAGLLSHSLDNTVPQIASELTPGSTWNFQAWYRDPLSGGAAFNLSDGLELTFLP